MGMLPGAAEITLKWAIKIDGADLRTLIMRRPKVRDQLAVEAEGVITPEGEMRLFANLCEVTPETIQELDLADYATLQETYTGFLPKSAI